MTRLSCLPALFATSLFVSACGSGDTSGTGGKGGETSTATGGGGTATGGTTTGGATTGGTGGSGGATTTTTTGGGGGGTTTTSGGGGAGGAIDLSGELFTLDGIADIELTLPPLSVQLLGQDPYTYVHGGMTVHLTNGKDLSFADVGVRLKGVYGSFRTLDQKAAFLVKLDKYVGGQDLLGIEKLALNNMVQDPSMIHERIGYDLFRGMGIAAPRSAYARVSVNGALYGLYATVEHTDNSQMLKRYFGDDKGSLYEGAYGTDLYSGLIASFDQDNGVDVGLTDLQELVDALDTMNDPTTFLGDAGQVLDMAEYTDFAATEIFLGHWDGYAMYQNNYYIYRMPDGRWTFLPWGIDQTFSDYLDLWGGNGRIEQMCLASVPCRLALKDSFVKAIGKVDELGLVAEVDTLKSLLSAAIEEDPRKEVDSGTAYAWMQGTKDFLLGRPGDVTARFVCADPTGVDGDGDGAPGCGFDCNDGDKDVYPGATEVCNFKDDNCDGLVDDDPMCPGCVTSPAPGGGNFAFCFKVKTYVDAEADCVAQGGHLVSIHDQATQDAAVSGAFAIAGGEWWIGLDDMATEGSFAWLDGTPVDYTTWAGGEPNNAGDTEDCGHLASWAGGLWNDIPCDQTLAYVCELP